MAQRSTKAMPAGRRRLFRAVALLMVPAMLALLEGICLWMDWGNPRRWPVSDPGLSGANSLFVLDEEKERFVVRPVRRRFFAPESFPARKGSNVFRIFCLGGSTVQGRPWSKETAFSTWLRLGLEAADQSREWEVINCGGVSYASDRLVPLVRECLRYAPDLMVLCTGHNEFLEERSYRLQKQAPRWMGWVSERLMRLRLAVLAHSAWRRVNGTAETTTPGASGTDWKEVDALLDHPGGLEAYQWDAEQRAAVVDAFGRNVRQILRLAEQADLPVLMVLPPSNLRDSPPFKSQHRSGMTAAERHQWSQAVDRAQAAFPAAPREAGDWLRRAIALDEQYAQTHFDLGKSHLASGRPERARAAFLRARERDVCPLRILRPMEAALREASRRFGVPLLDAHELLESRSQWGILGGDWLVDHVHPSMRGHELMADTLLGMMGARGWVTPRAGWEARRAERVRQHYQRLPPLYYARGQQRLENLRAWAAGRIGEETGAPEAGRER